MKRFALLATLALAACSSEPPVAPDPLKWTTMGDGSQVTVGEVSYLSDQFFDGPSAVMRCWPLDAGFDCLVGTRRSYQFINFARMTVPELPTSHLEPLDPLNPPAGYGCIVVFQGAWHESVHSEAGEIKVNVVSDYERPLPDSWSRTEVETLFRENGIQPVGNWMNCKNLSNVVGRTSLAAAASTEVTKAMLDETS